MAFKKNAPVLSAPDSPAKLFQTLTRRKLPDVMTHQRDMLTAYGEQMVKEKDVALQLPTGSGKTLVGLLIAEWRRRKFQERVVYLCPTRQLVNQTVDQAQNRYGIDAIGFTNSKHDYPAAAKSDYLTGSKVAVTTYSSLFNVSPFFTNPDLIIIDDAHAAENYIAKMWSLEIPSGDFDHAELHAAISGLLRPYLTGQSYARLTGEWKDPSDATWVDKLPSTILQEIAPQLTAILDANSDASDDVKYRWRLLRDHLHACHLYLASREILIRPLIPPVWTHGPYANAKQRIYMSATLGAGGDLERLTGTASIKRLPAPEGFRSTGVGRRFFIFPGLSLEPAECEKLRLKMQKLAGRSVVLTPNDAAAAAIGKQVKELDDFEIFNASDIENSKDDFVKAEKAAAIMAGRFDGIDFPDDECRLLCLDGLPKATNAQERFLMTKMSATALFNERLQTRVLQAAGRCTRALQDRSAVFVTGHELLEYLADNRNWEHFHPELQAELAFGVEQSKDVETGDLITNFKSFLANKNDWSEANASILDDADNYSQIPYPAMDILEDVVAREVRYQKALWMGDAETALVEAKAITAKLTAPELRGYRALWHYLAGAVAWSMSKKSNDSHQQMAREQFGEAMKAAPNVGWLARLAKAESAAEAAETELVDQDAIAQVERLEAVLLAMGTANDRAFEKKAKRTLKNLAKPETFEEGQRELGELLGFIPGNQETDAAPDPWWLGETKGIVFEDHAKGDSGTVFGAEKAKQAALHPDWIKENVTEADGLDISVILVTPCTKAGTGAKPALKKVHYWLLDDFRQWAKDAINTIRELKAKLPPHGDLFWREDAFARLHKDELTQNTIVGRLSIAADVMDFTSN
ncbi:DEAD/DEAH box helicase [Sphingobium yanoikuyae]|uniref:DEAD/DEAH box helicase n=1 Tax=Sphingobium yanoikuyae TaxID=13690 RepID=UPI0028DB07CC|nr:DEAD/DEAH box helicase [Sphingobium yanoikuyae]